MTRAEAEHVVVARLLAGVLPHVLHAEIRITVFAGHLYLETLPLHHLLLASHFRIFGSAPSPKARSMCSAEEFPPAAPSKFGRTRRTIQQLYQLGLLRIHELVMMRDFTQQLGSFELSFQHILLTALANAIASVCDFLDLFKKLTVAVENLQGLLDISDLKVRFLHLLKNGAPVRLRASPCRRQRPAGLLRP